MLSRFTPAGGWFRPRLAVLLVGVIALGIAGCGRRGQPEAPTDPNAPQRAKPGASATPSRGARSDSGSSSAGNRVEATPTTVATRPGALVDNSPDSETDEEDPNLTVSPQPTPVPTPRRRRPTYQVPKEPFILDPLL